MENIGLYSNVEIYINKSKAIAVLTELVELLKINNQEELLRILMHYELNKEVILTTMKIQFSEIAFVDKKINLNDNSTNLIVKITVNAGDVYSFDCSGTDFLVYVNDINFFETIILDQIKIIDLENSKKMGQIGSIKIKYAKFKEALTSSNQNFDELFEKLLNKEIFIDAHPSQCFFDLFKTGQIGLKNKELFLTSEFATPEFSDFLDENEDIIFQDPELFNKVMKESKLSVKSLLNLVKRRIAFFIPGIDIVLKDSFVENLDNEYQSHESIFDLILENKLKVSNSPSLIDLFDSNDFLTQNQVLSILLSKNKMKFNYIENLIFKENFNEELSSFVLSNNSFIIYHPMTLLKIDNNKLLDAKAISVLSERYEINCNKTKQKEVALKYQGIYQNIDSVSVFSSVIDTITDDLVFLYAISSQITPGIVNSVMLQDYNLESCEFDADLMPLISIAKLDRICLAGLSELNMKADFIQFVHDLPSIDLAFKHEKILKHKNCPALLLSGYIRQPLLYLYILKNENLSQSDLNFIYEQNMYYKQDYRINDLIVKHPNCPKHLILKISQGEVYIFNKIKNSTSEIELNTIMKKLIAYPSNDLAQYRLSPRMICIFMDEIVKNKYSDENTLDLYAGYFDFLTDITVCKNVVNHKFCKKEYLTEIINENKNDYIEPIIYSDRLTEELSTTILTKKLNNLVFQSKNMYSVEFLNAKVDPISAKLLKDKSELCHSFIQNLKNELLNIKKMTDPNFTQYILKYLKENNYSIYGGLIPVSPADLT